MTQEGKYTQTPFISANAGQLPKATDLFDIQSLTQAPPENAAYNRGRSAIGGAKIKTENAWLAIRPSGTGAGRGPKAC